ncbi:MAG: carboxymuconolactone decarboxylase family protein [Candidatus Hermodarchaeota archaeon]
MNEEDRKKIEKIVKDRNESDKKLKALGSKVYNAFLNLEKQTYLDGNLKKYYKELIAIGISIIINCESCSEWHIKEALKSGASAEQILEAIEVAIEMGGGPATVSSRFALKVLEYYSSK